MGQRTCSDVVTIFHVTGLATYRNQVHNVDIPLEANDESHAIEQAIEWLANKRSFAIQLQAHRCPQQEKALAEWVRNQIKFALRE